LIPPAAFYLLLAKSLVSLPFMDDYQAVLGFLLQWKNETGLGRLFQIATYQHNEYRCMFGNAITGIQYQILGHTNLQVLSILGDLFVLPLFGLLYLIWRECGRPRDYTILAFVPASWILFQLQYESTLNFASSGLQNIPVIVFALLACFLASKAGATAFLGTLLSLLLSIASSGNGLFLIPIGAIIYLQHREYKRLVAWCALSGIACLVYFHGYNFKAETPITHMDNNVLGLLQHLSLPYAAAFLGSIAAMRNPLPAILFGIVLVGVFILATSDRLFARRPALYYSMLFFIVTGLAVSGLRSSLGIASAITSRYRINSTVLLILLYLYLADKFYGIHLRPLILKACAFVVGVLLIGFTAESDRVGEKLLLARRRALEVEMMRWQRHEPRHALAASFPGDFTAENEKNGLYDPIEPFFSESIREGIYQIPALPAEH
jgi:hypothetical protein